MLSTILVKVAGMEKEERTEYFPRPSLAGPERCIRQMVYWAKGIPEDKQISDRFMLTIDDSSFHELLTADWLRKSAFTLHSVGMEVNTRIGAGHIDGILTDMFLVDRLYEHKALNHFAFENYWKEKAYPLDYFTQCALYLDALKEDLPEISEAILLVKNKNTAQYIDYLLRLEGDALHVLELEHSNGKAKRGNPYLFSYENVIENAVKKFEEIEAYRKSDMLPERPYEMDDWHCSYCSWGQTCWESLEKEYSERQECAELDSEAIELAQYFVECRMHIRDMNRQVREMESELLKLKQKLNALLSKRNLKQAKAGEYLITTKIQERKVIDKDNIPEDILKKATRIIKTILVNVSKPQTERKIHDFRETEE